MDTSRDAVTTNRTLPRGLLVFCGALAVAAGVGVVVTGNLEFVFYLAVLLILAGLVYWAHRHVGFSAAALWLLAAWAALHMAGGLVTVPASWPTEGDSRVLYSWWLIPGWLKYDHVVHAFGFGVSTLVCYEGLLSTAGAGAGERVGRSLILFAALSALGLGALNEVVEFVATLLVPETNVGGYVNTGWDLVANLTGVTAVSLGLWLRSRTR